MRWWLILAWLVAIVLVDPRADVPLIDDWTWAYSVEGLLTGKGFTISSWSASSPVAQIWWGTLWASIGGFSYTVLRLSTLALAAAGTLAMYGLLRSLGCGPRRALLGAATLLVYPVAFVLSFTFMTDIHMLALAIGSLWAIAAALAPRPPSARGDGGRLVLGLALAVVAFLVRPVALAIPLALLVTAVIHSDLPGRRRIVVLAVVTLIAMAGATALVSSFPRYEGDGGLVSRTHRLRYLFAGAGDHQRRRVRHLVGHQRRRGAAQHRHDRQDRWHVAVASAAHGRQRRHDQRTARARERRDRHARRHVQGRDGGQRRTRGRHGRDADRHDRSGRRRAARAARRHGGRAQAVGRHDHGRSRFTVTGSFAWSDGDQEGPGATVLAAGATGVVSDSARLREDRELRNAGTLTIDDATLFMGRGSAIRNAGLLVLDGTASVADTAFRYGYGDAGLVHNTGTLRKTGTGTAVAEATIDNDGLIEVLDGRLELPELLDWSGPMFAGAGTLAGGTYVVGNGAALLLPGPLKANAARLALGAGSQVLYNELTGTGVQVRDGLGGLLRNAGGGVLELTGGRSLTVAGTFSNQGVLALGAGSVLNTGGFTQAAGAVLRPTVAASAGRVAAAGAVQLGGRLDVVAPVAVGGDVPVLTGAVAGTFAAVSGEYAPTYTAGGVTVRRPGGEEPKSAAIAPALAAPALVAPASTPAAVKPAAKAKAKPKKPAKRKSKKAVKKKRR